MHFTTPTAKFARQRFESNPGGELPTDWQSDQIAVEEPLQIRLCWFENNKQRIEILAVTLRSPGDDIDLITGFLFSEGIIQHANDIVSITIENTEGIKLPNQVTVSLSKQCEFQWEHVTRYLAVNSACGLCGKTSIQHLELRDPPDLPRFEKKVSRANIIALTEQLRAKQSAFHATGGMHGVASFSSDGQLIAVREDVGRHNALDKLVGHQLQHAKDLPKERILVVSGRASFELVYKAIMSGFGAMIAVGAPSSLAIQTAQRFDLTLIGFVQQNRFNLYHGEWRLTDL